MKHRRLLYFYLAVMVLLLLAGLCFPARFTALLSQPHFYVHVKFLHVLFATLLFGNAVIGTFWEARALWSDRLEIVRHTYATVTWLDALFTAPVIIAAVLTGLMLATVLGGVFKIGWVVLAFVLFLGTGLLWVAADIPNQYRLNRLLEENGAAPGPLPPPLKRLLWRRMLINAGGILPLLVVFYLMVHKPPLIRLNAWLNRSATESPRR